MWRLGAITGTALAVMLCFAAAGPDSARAQDTLAAMCTSGGQTAPCTSSWYSSSVSVVWSATPPPTSTSGCQLGIAYTYASDSVTNLSCSAAWSDGSFASSGFPLHVEVSAPAVQAVPSRPPDDNGWYNHPVAVTFTGNAFSGIVGCAPSVQYAGPSGAAVTVTGSCTDNAGKVAAGGYELNYDAAPPQLTLRATPADHVVALRWTVADVAPLGKVRVTRTPGVHGTAPSVIYVGRAAGLADRRVANGRRYRYSVQVTDEAGNVNVETLSVKPGPRLESPEPGARLHTPPLLSWTPVVGASYYNVQLFRGGKVLSTWPSRAEFQLHGTWRFNGRRYHLRPGRYFWYVWPGFGTAAAARYGRLIGSSSFVIS